MTEKNKLVDILVFNKNNDNVKKSQYYSVHFSLDDEQNAGLRFSHDPDTVLWAAYVPTVTSPCVDEECHIPELFVDPAIPIEDDKIVVINVDRTEKYFAFGFNFLRPGDSDGPTTNYALYDPIGSNQDGGNNLSLFSTETIGGLVAGAAIGGALAMAFS
jgi:hypothetical protein